MKKLTTLLLIISSFLYSQAQDKKLAFDKNGKFKIIQFTDIHYKANSDESAKSIKMMEMLLDEEKPDMVAFTGDIVTNKDSKTGWDEVLETVISRKIPHAVVLGNHDDEQNWTRKDIIDYVMTKPFSMTQKGPAYLKGASNYILEVDGKNNKSEAILYFMDSNAYNKIGEQKGYDWFGFDQVDWYKQNSAYYTKQNGDKPYPALAFFHIPLQEYTLLSDTTKNYIKQSPVFGTRTEKECPGFLNTGMFTAMVLGGDVMGTFTGHDHDNDYIGYLNGICLAYGRFSGSKTTYTNLGYGARVIELQEGKRSFDSWIRTHDNQVIHKVNYPNSFETKK